MPGRLSHRLNQSISTLIICILTLTACGMLEVGIEPPATATPGATAVDTTSPTRDTGQSVTPDAPTMLPSAPTISPTPPWGVELPGAVYLLSTELSGTGRPRSVWRLDPGETELERVTSPELDIPSFDIWHGDGRIAYGTENGRLYVHLPEQEPRLLYDAGLQAGSEVVVDSVVWSPEGERLAFSVRHLSQDHTESKQDGLWLISLTDEIPLRLLSNQYLNADASNVNEVRVISDPIWSPDGTALVLTGYYWEWTDILWLDPVAPDPVEANLNESPGGLWLNGSWAADSQSILLSGVNYSQFGNLAFLRRDTDELELLVSGEAEGLFIYHAQELPAGVAFLASDPAVLRETRLYLGHRTEDGFVYAPAGPDHSLCSSGYVRDITWDPAGQFALLSCSQGVQLISLDGGVDVDLAPFLGPLAGEDSVETLWGPGRESD